MVLHQDWLFIPLHIFPQQANQLFVITSSIKHAIPSCYMGGRYVSLTNFYSEVWSLNPHSKVTLFKSEAFGERSASSLCFGGQCLWMRLRELPGHSALCGCSKKVAARNEEEGLAQDWQKPFLVCVIWYKLFRLETEIPLHHPDLSVQPCVYLPTTRVKNHAAFLYLPF